MLEHTQRIDFRIENHGVCDSTSERAFASLADGSAKHGDVHVADAQTNGRGRQGNRWLSPEGLGLYMSVVLLPPPPPLSPTALTIGCGLAVRDAVCSLGVTESELKWPNDILIGDAKLAGILVESRGLVTDRPHYVLGLGINVKQREFPMELTTERPVTSLALAGVEVNRATVLESVLAALPKRLEQVRTEDEQLAAEYLAAIGLYRSTVRVGHGDGVASGRLVGLSIADGLLLEVGEGNPWRIPLEYVRSLVRA